ncbi:ornithine decarboxylase antizyme [Aspergillus chevalieri]|uniref:Ornithine decarboxylase antizyme n=1 Tax=Aspergillus chevalieri TaxID=182096 RepID=A0A7R7VX15_ASPCH|nr:uncharacterized protein ACHE_80237S [Aspergillus chevalieri]BCR92337.1 hypothetical protein ACHE_80237S [Aspergillus chevalieri]
MLHGERRLARQVLLEVGACQANQQGHAGQEHKHIQSWMEVWDYTSDAIYRGFVTETSGERTLFVFFEDNALGHGLKSGLIALFELAGMSAFGCSQIVACIQRSQDTAELEVVRNLGWCGFNLTTLGPWLPEDCSASAISPKWIFLCAEV